MTLARYKTQEPGREVGNRTKGDYRQLIFKDVPFQVTHIIHFPEKGELPRPGFSIDHEDGKPANDRAANLRLATAKQQAQNRKQKFDADGLPKGCERDERGVWVPGMLGPFKSAPAAVKAKMRNNVKRFGKFARTALRTRPAITGGRLVLRPFGSLISTLDRKTVTSRMQVNRGCRPVSERLRSTRS